MSKLTDWLSNHFHIDDIIYKKEYKFPCPKCQHPNFYFNVKKQKGWCHRATCHFSPGLKDLIKIVGYGPEEDVGLPSYRELETNIPNIEIILPPGCEPIIDCDPVDGGQRILSRPLNALWMHRNIGPEACIKWDIRYRERDKRIYVPIYENGKLVQYISRKEWGVPIFDGEKRYVYAAGAPVTHYLLGWGEAKRWDRLTLVENTFNAIWLRDELYCSTNFGSHLSETQIDKIVKSNIKSVVLIWDEGTDERAEKAIRRLHNESISAVYVQINKQPDNWPPGWLRQIADEAHVLALEDKELRLDKKVPSV